jgi:hypothetical protein
MYDMNRVHTQLSIFLLGCILSISISNAQTNSLVYEGPDGRLLYGAFANQGKTNTSNRVPDYSRAGYMGGGTPIPFIPAAVVVTNMPGDDTTLIQNAIDTVEALPLGTNGFRGAVLLKAGTFEVSSTLFINASGVVLRGEGSQETGGTKILFTATVQDNLFSIAGSGSPSEVGGTRTAVTDSFVPIGATSFNVADSSGYSAGDQIRTQHKINDTWITELGMDNLGSGTPWTAADYQLYCERVVTGVTGSTIYVDAPFVQAVEDLYGGADIYKYTQSGRIEHVGIESIRLESTYLNDNDEAHGWRAIDFYDVRHGWARQVSARYFGYSCVNIGSDSQHITVEDCAMLDPKSQTTGGRKYSFNISGSSFGLFQRCYTWGGRHDFVSGAKTHGPNVFVDCSAVNTKSDIGPHHRYATGQLYDNVNGGSMNVQNRYNSGTGHGWAGAQIMFWNCDGSGMVCEAPRGGMNWSIGNKVSRNNGSWVNEPDGIWESHNTFITAPRSLYYKQLEDRLGKDAVRNVILPEQESGTVWTAINAWAGDGLFGDDVVAWQADDVITFPTNSVSVRGIVRNLQMLDNGSTSQWSKVSGPGNVTFGSETNLETTATFSIGGTYVMRLTVGDGTTTASSDVSVLFDDGTIDVSATGASAMGAGQATLNGSLDSGGPAEITVVWDVADQGTNLGAWASSSVIPGQGLGAFSAVATGLTPEITYTYRCYASNTVDTGWSSAMSFIVPTPAVVVGSLLSRDSIVGRRQTNAPALGYYVDANNNLSGVGGSATTSTREDRIVVLGFTLPALPVGSTVSSAILNFEITAARDHNNQDPSLNVYVLNTSNPDSSGTNYYYHGPSNTTTEAKYVGSTYIDVGTGSESYPDDLHDQSYVISGDALTLIQSFYGGDHLPDQAEVFFRFNLNIIMPSLSGLAYERYFIDLAADESSLQISHTTPAGYDADGDGMLDSWENTMFGDTTSSDGTGDQDGDRFLDLHEFIAGTDATNNSSYLYVDSVSALASNQFQLSWPGVTGKTYTVLFKTNLFDVVWSTNASGISGVAPITVSTNALPASKGFFRIQVE